MYSVYWYGFKDYKGKSITEQLKASHPYQGILYKVGHQFGIKEFGRVEENAVKDKGIKPTWIELWGEIRCLGILKGFKTKEEAIEVEKLILKELGPKDFNLHENISGISEFRIANSDRKLTLQRHFSK